MIQESATKQPLRKKPKGTELSPGRMAQSMKDKMHAQTADSIASGQVVKTIGHNDPSFQERSQSFFRPVLR